MENAKFNRITGIMSEEGIDNKDLAKYLGVTVETVSKWRTNRGQPSLKKLYRTAEYFKVGVCDLLVPRNWPSGSSAAEIDRLEKEKKKSEKLAKANKKKKRKRS